MTTDRLYSRRRFLQHSVAVGVAAATQMNTIGRVAHAASGDDYKALVCILLAGGADAFNMLVPYDTNRYNDYVAFRSDLALAARRPVAAGVYRRARPDVRCAPGTWPGAHVVRSGRPCVHRQRRHAGGAHRQDRVCAGFSAAAVGPVLAFGSDRAMANVSARPPRHHRRGGTHCRHRHGRGADAAGLDEHLTERHQRLSNRAERDGLQPRRQRRRPAARRIRHPDFQDRSRFDAGSELRRCVPAHVRRQVPNRDRFRHGVQGGARCRAKPRDDVLERAVVTRASRKSRRSSACGMRCRPTVTPSSSRWEVGIITTTC